MRIYRLVAFVVAMFWIVLVVVFIAGILAANTGEINDPQALAQFKAQANAEVQLIAFVNDGHGQRIYTVMVGGKEGIGICLLVRGESKCFLLEQFKPNPQ